MKQYRVVTQEGIKEFANLIPALNYQDKHGGVLEFLSASGVWYSVK